jgi:hypothetical protein
MVNGAGFGGESEIIKFQKLELMTLPLRAGSQDVASKQCIGLGKMCNLPTCMLHRIKPNVTG